MMIDALNRTLRIMFGDRRPHYPTRYSRDQLPQWVQRQRIAAAKAKRARRRVRNILRQP